MALTVGNIGKPLENLFPNGFRQKQWEVHQEIFQGSFWNGNVGEQWEHHL